MQKNELLQMGEAILRVLSIDGDRVLVIDCVKRNMPKWYRTADLDDYSPCTEQELIDQSDVEIFDVDALDSATRKIVHDRYTIIAGVLPFLADEKMRSLIISRIADEHEICKQTVRNYLCLYLAFQNLSALAPKRIDDERPLSKDEKNMRWALNKFFYTKNQNSLPTAYTMMLREKYSDSAGTLLPEFPTFNQFRYFYRKHKKLQTYYISRNGIKSYQRNNRPLIGDGVREFAPAVGVGMLDSTVCDIYLVDEANNLVGRPILTACVDAYSGLCCGYALSWEGGVQSLRRLLASVIANKVALCKQFGITIKEEDWGCKQLPATLVTDKGSEYVSANFDQIVELGVRLINLPPYRPELKGSVEKFFDVIQDLYKPYLKGKGVIEPDFQDRGAHDYRKDACLTLKAFETILLRCIVYYNSSRLIENFPYTDAMLDNNVQPKSSTIWNWSMSQAGANLITVSHEQLMLTLLPRTEGTFSRNGLKVNQMRYAHSDYIESYLNGGTATVAYNPDDVSCVWVVENGSYTQFDLIENRFNGKGLTSVQTMQAAQRAIIKDATQENLQAKIDLAEHICTIANQASSNGKTQVKSIRENRKRTQRQTYTDYMKVGGAIG